MVNTIVSGATLATKDTILGGLYIMDNRYDYEVTLTSSSKDNVDNVTKVFMGKVNKPKLTRIASCEQIEDNCTDNNGLFHRYLRVSYISPIYFNAFYGGMELYEYNKKMLDKSYKTWTEDDFKSHNIISIIDLAKDNNVTIEVNPLHNHECVSIEKFIVSSEGDITNLSPNEEHMTHIENTTMRSE